ncbi:ECs_2282 family putative zinc-binding protein [Rahnella inusitata]|uniref:ECs_2282 family putative zinc-binding protein n=1 Tax=Rahnella inusitata TaxID=58169 RepID=UPI0039BE9F8B
MVLEIFSCPICRCEFLIFPENFHPETNFVDVCCAGCGLEVTKKDLLKLTQTGDSKRPRKLDTSML